MAAPNIWRQLIPLSLLRGDAHLLIVLLPWRVAHEHAPATVVDVGTRRAAHHLRQTHTRVRTMSHSRAALSSHGARTSPETFTRCKR